MVKRGFLTLLLFIAGLRVTPGFASCGDAERATPDYRAAESCLVAKAGEAVGGLPARVLGPLSPRGPHYCRLPGSEGPVPSLDGQICSDPNGFVCGPENRTAGRVMNSKCEYLHLDSELAARTPSWVDLKCTVDAKVEALYREFQASSCAKIHTRICRQRFRVRHHAKLQALERAEIYSPERLERVQKAFDRVRSKFVELVRISERIPGARKESLINTLLGTELITGSAKASALQNNRHYPECLNSTKGYPRTGAFNTDLVEPPAKRGVYLCAGFMANLEQINPYLLLQILGHELAHSIDPCELDTLIGVNAATQVFPGLTQCLRGGGGESGCGKGAVLNCTTKAGIREECGIEASCLSLARATPNCTHGGPGHMHQVGEVASSGDYRDRGAPLEQIGEAFSDFMGAEIVGRLMSEDSAVPPGQPDARGKRDALVSIASSYSRLHGACLKANTVDEHPPGYLRMNRLIMGSGSFRDAFGCRGAPATSGAGVTCKAF